MLVYKARLTPNTGKPRTRTATDPENRDPLNRKQQGVLDAPAAPVRRSATLLRLVHLQGPVSCQPMK